MSTLHLSPWPPPPDEIGATEALSGSRGLIWGLDCAEITTHPPAWVWEALPSVHGAGREPWDSGRRYIVKTGRIGPWINHLESPVVLLGTRHDDVLVYGLSQRRSPQGGILTVLRVAELIGGWRKLPSLPAKGFTIAEVDEGGEPEEEARQMGEGDSPPIQISETSSPQTTPLTPRRPRRNLKIGPSDPPVPKTLEHPENTLEHPLKVSPGKGVPAGVLSPEGGVSPEHPLPTPKNGNAYQAPSGRPERAQRTRSAPQPVSAEGDPSRCPADSTCELPLHAHGLDLKEGEPCHLHPEHRGEVTSLPSGPEMILCRQCSAERQENARAFWAHRMTQAATG